MPMTRKRETLKVCPVCGRIMERKRFNGRLEDMTRFTNRKYCSLKCAGMASRKPEAEATLGAARKRSAKLRGSRCEICGTAENLQAHHLDMNPWNNAPENIMTLCGTCHTKWHWKHGKSPYGKSGTQSKKDGLRNQPESPA